MHTHVKVEGYQQHDRRQDGEEYDVLRPLGGDSQVGQQHVRLLA